MKTLWKGTLATGGRAPEEFEAEVVESDDGALAVIKRRGLETTVVPAPAVRGDYWLRTVADLARKAGAS